LAIAAVATRAGLRSSSDVSHLLARSGCDLVSSIQHCGFLVRWFGLHHHQNGQPSSLSRDAPSPFQLAEKGAVSDHIETNSRDLTRPLESPFVFPSTGAKSGHIENMSRTKGFPYAPHMMRHTYRTHAMEAGVDFQTVTLLLNHANPHVSFNYVTRAHLLGHMREAQEEVCARLASFR
jgi:hypothetical protein